MTLINENQERLRFQDFQLVRQPNGRTAVSVEMDWTRGRSYRGSAEGNQTLEGEVRAAAEATLQAVSGATDHRLEMGLRGAKAVRVFDSWVVVVIIRGSLDGEFQRLLGAYPCPDEDTPRGAVMAVLDATNRILGRHLVE